MFSLFLLLLAPRTEDPTGSCDMDGFQALGWVNYTVSPSYRVWKPLAHKVILGICGGGVHTILTRGWGQGDMDRKPNLMHVSSHLQMSVPRSSWDSSATWAVTSLLLAFLLHLRPPRTSSAATCELPLGSRAHGRRLRLWA